MVAFIDQDDGNGNTARARRTVEEYAIARQHWRSGGAHALGNDSSLFRPLIRLLLPEEPLWVPHPDASSTLDRVVGKRDAIDDALMDLLFAQGDEEQQMPLEKGYQARPNIGATAIALASESKDAKRYFDALEMEMGKASQGRQVRLLVAGSLFGGTGAGGFPTLARLLSQKAPKVPADRFAMAGTLMLPYFCFPPPDEVEGASANFARADQFFLQSRSALRYYHRLKTEGQLPFRRMMLIGWDELFPTGGPFTPGGSGQENDAMPPELLAALASCGFLSGEAPVPEAQTIEVGTRKEAGQLGWTDCPVEGGNPLRAYQQLGQAVRFAIGWDYYGRHVREEADKPKRFGLFPPSHAAFFEMQGLKRVDWKSAAHTAPMQALSSYGESLLEWAKQVERSARELGGFGLWQLDAWKQHLPDLSFGKLYDAAITPPENAVPANGSADLKAQLDELPGDGTAAGLGVMVERLHAATAVS